MMSSSGSSSDAVKLRVSMCLPPQEPHRTCVRWEMMMIGGTSDTRTRLPDPLAECCSAPPGEHHT